MFDQIHPSPRGRRCPDGADEGDFGFDRTPGVVPDRTPLIRRCAAPSPGEKGGLWVGIGTRDRNRPKTPGKPPENHRYSAVIRHLWFTIGPPDRQDGGPGCDRRPVSGPSGPASCAFWGITVLGGGSKLLPAPSVVADGVAGTQRGPRTGGLSRCSGRAIRRRTRRVMTEAATSEPASSAEGMSHRGSGGTHWNRAKVRNRPEFPIPWSFGSSLCLPPCPLWPIPPRLPDGQARSGRVSD
jgi:hypothetical protein